jgi:hypothetical protein
LLTALLLISLWLGARQRDGALLLLSPLVLLAVPGVASLRRGAANAFDWFGMITFSVFALLAWIGWSAMVFGWPEKLATTGCSVRARIRRSLQHPGRQPRAARDVDLVLVDCHQPALANARDHALDGRSDPVLAVDRDALDAMDRLRKKLSSGVRVAGKGTARASDIASSTSTPPTRFSPPWTISTDIRTLAQDPLARKNCDLLLMQGSARHGGVSMAAGWREDLGGGSTRSTVAPAKSYTSTSAKHRPCKASEADSSTEQAAAVSQPDEMLAVVLQLFDRLADICKRGVIGTS